MLILLEINLSGGIDVAKALGAFCQLIPDMFTASFLRRLAQHSAPTQGLRWDLSFYCHTEAGVTLRPCSHASPCCTSHLLALCLCPFSMALRGLCLELDPFHTVAHLFSSALLVLSLGCSWQQAVFLPLVGISPHWNLNFSEEASGFLL